MSYTKLTDFAVKDSLPSGTGAKIVRGTELDAEFNAIQADSVLKAPLASPTFTGTVTVPTPVNATDAATKGVVDALLASPAFTGTPTAPTAAPGTSTTQLATTAFVQTQAFSAALPSQTGNAGKYVTTNGTTASWGAPPALVLLATLTPTVSANIDFLTTFTSGYDNYLIIGDGISVAVDDGIRIRLANAGVVDSGTNYYSVAAAVSTSTTTAVAQVSVTPNITSAGVGATFSIEVKNVNDAVKIKTIKSNCVGQTAATPGFTSTYTDAAYTPASTVSGFRLYLAGGNNFAATGRVRVYGINNS